MPSKLVIVPNLWPKIQSTVEGNIAKKLDEEDCSPRSADMPDSDGLAVHVDPNGETVVENEKEERLLHSHNRTGWKVERAVDR